jgi:hypothetical protein
VHPARDPRHRPLPTQPREQGKRALGLARLERIEGNHRHLTPFVYCTIRRGLNSPSAGLTL